MSKIGIIVNPFSGKDLRRVTTQAEVVDYQSKIKKVLRMIEAMKKFRVERVFLMPDSCFLNYTIAEQANKDSDSGLKTEILDFMPTDQPEDTVKAVMKMKDLGVNCLIVVGGDGTSRLVAGADLEIPMIPVSTGTNNVYPKSWEGTTAGVAAAYISQNGTGVVHLEKDKRIDIYINNRFVDIALVDAVLTNIPYIGSKIVSSVEDMREIVVCRCSPELIGFSSLVGSLRICEEDDDFGYRLLLDEKGTTYLASISSGQLVNIAYSELEKLDIGMEYVSRPDYDGTVALDGERTITFKRGDEIKFVIDRKGPLSVDVKEILCEAVQNGFFQMSPTSISRV